MNLHTHTHTHTHTRVYIYIYIHTHIRIRIAGLFLGLRLLCAVMYVFKLENGDGLNTIFHYLRKITDAQRILGHRVIITNYFKA